MKTRRWSVCGRGASRVSVLGAALLSLLAASRAQSAVTFGQLDNFQNGTEMGWAEGTATPNPPTNVATGGPAGEGDRFLENVSSGGAGAGAKQVMFNQSQWAGNYNAAGVTRIDASLANFGPAPLYIRLAIASPAFDQFGSKNAVELPADGVWRRVSFDLTADALTQIAGANGLPATLSNVQTLRVLSAQSGPSFFGDAVDARLGVDDIRALRLPGDANFDGRVDSADFRIARLHLGERASATWAQGDFNFDGRVSASDILLLRRNFGSSIPSTTLGVTAASSRAAAPLPEPATATVLALAAAVSLLRRRRRA